MSENKDQHYVSAFYLYNFTNDSQRNRAGDNKRKTLIWHFDRKKGFIKERPIEKLATESYLFSFQNQDGSYDHSLDENLKQVEANASQAFSELSDIVSSFKISLKNQVNVESKTIEKIIEFIVWQIRRHPELVADIHEKCIELCERSDWDMNPKKMALDVIAGLGKDVNFDLSEILMQKNKTIIFTTNELAKFITTDKPFVRYNKSNPNGISYDDTEIYFPLSSNMMLYLQGNGNRKVFRELNDLEFLRKFNVYMAEKSKNYIFGCTREHVETIVQSF